MPRKRRTTGAGKRWLGWHDLPRAGPICLTGAIGRKKEGQVATIRPLPGRALDPFGGCAPSSDCPLPFRWRGDYDAPPARL